MVKLAHGIYRPPDQVSDLVGRASALLAASPVGTVICGRTAAAVHGLWLPPGLDATDGTVETIVHRHIGRPSERARSRRPQLRSRRQLLALDEIVEVGGLPVTSEARTWLDLADRLQPADLVALGDSALRGDATMAELAEMVRRAAHRPGVVRARDVLPLLDGRSRSRPESHVRYILHAAGLPRPEVNVAVFSAFGEWLCEPDLSYDDVGLAIEYNGREHAETDRMRSDITRTVDVEDRGGWRVVTFGPAEVFRRPDQIARRIRQPRHELSGRPAPSGRSNPV